MPSEFEITKGSRFQRIIGQFAEHLVCNWLARSGFEVGILDHTGLDLVAFNPVTRRRLGISVKARTRIPGREAGSVTLLDNRKGDRRLLEAACDAFACEPWLAVYVETTEHGELFLTSLQNYDAKYRGRDDKRIADWKMGREALSAYREDPEVNYIRIEFADHHWQWAANLLESS